LITLTSGRAMVGMVAASMAQKAVPNARDEHITATAAAVAA